MYAICGLQFDADALLESDGFVLLVPSADRFRGDGSVGSSAARDADAPGQVHLTLKRIPLGQEAKAASNPFEAGVERERRALVASLPDAKILERTTLTLAGRAARLFAHGGSSADGLPICHHQAFIEAPEAMVVLSAVGFAENRDTLRGAFEGLLASVTEDGEAKTS